MRASSDAETSVMCGVYEAISHAVLLMSRMMLLAYVGVDAEPGDLVVERDVPVDDGGVGPGDQVDQRTAHCRTDGGGESESARRPLCETRAVAGKRRAVYWSSCSWPRLKNEAG